MKAFDNIRNWMAEIATIANTELRRVLGNKGVLMVFLVAGLGYPLLFNLIYQKENLENLPIAIVDESQCVESRRFAHKIDATPELEVRYRCSNINEARHLMKQRKINGIVYFPADFGDHLAHGETARVGLFCDMSSFFYYKNLFLGSNVAMLDEMKLIQLQHYSLAGINGKQAEDLVTPVGYDDVSLFVSGGGFASFLIPALLVLVIHQTLFFGVGMLSGSARQMRLKPLVAPGRRGAIKDVLGRSMAYLVVYIPLSTVVLVLIPYLFGLPFSTNGWDKVAILCPFLLSATFLAITGSSFMRDDVEGIVTLVFSSLILLFLSGFAWPRQSMPMVWRWLSYLFPSTHGIQGFIRINSMGASLREVGFEYLMLWLLSALYFVTACCSVARRNRQTIK